MHRPCQMMLLLILAVSMSGTLLAGCARPAEQDNDNDIDEAQQAVARVPRHHARWDQKIECDALRVLARRKFIEDWGINPVAARARQFSAALSPDAISDLKAMIPEYNRFAVNPAENTANPFLVPLKKIFDGARASSGVTEVGGELPEISSSEADSELIEIARIASISAEREKSAAQIGDIQAVHFFTPANQSRYELKVDQVTDAVLHTSKQVTLLEHIQRNLPKQCSGVASKFKDETFNSIKGI